MFSLMRGSIPGAGKEPLDIAAQAAALGANEATFYSLFELSPTLDFGVLRDLRAKAADRGLSLAASLDWLNPLRLDRHQRELDLGGGDLARGVRRLLQAGALLGMREMFFTVGTLEDRAAPDWRAQLEAVAAFIAGLRPQLTELGMTLLVKTHEEITSFECLEMIERVGADILGVSYDPVNIMLRLEDPMEAARRLAAHVRQVHIDDAILRLEGATALRRYLAPVGRGILDWPGLLALLPRARRLIELHRGQFAVAVFDGVWLAGEHYVRVPEYAALLHAALRQPDHGPIDQNDAGLRLPAAIALAQ